MNPETIVTYALLALAGFLAFEHLVLRRPRRAAATTLLPPPQPHYVEARSKGRVFIELVEDAKKEAAGELALRQLGYQGAREFAASTAAAFATPPAPAPDAAPK